MAEVDKYVRGQPIERWLANRRDVQRELDSVARRKGAVASAILESHRHSGAAKITVESGLSDVHYGHIDRFVVLDDTQTAGNDPLRAMTIEFGRKANSAKRISHMPPVAPLRRAFRMTVKGGHA